MDGTLLEQVKAANEDFEWYPTTMRMIQLVASKMGSNAKAILDIGAGDGRVLKILATKCTEAKLYAIEKSNVLIQAQPDDVIPVGTDLYEQNLACLEVDYIFCNPPYSEYESWTSMIIESGYARYAYLIIPQRWADSAIIAESLKKRGAVARVVGSDHFLDAERSARAVVDILEIRFPRKANGYSDEVKDPFDIWFDATIDTFDKPEEPAPVDVGGDIAKTRKHNSIIDLVEAYNEEYNRLESNYKAIFTLDLAILKELGVNKAAVRDGIKIKMAGLKNKYWALMFERLDAITSRLCTETKKRFLAQLNGRNAIAFTATNAYAVVLWAIKNANKYYNQQLVKLFKDLSVFDGVNNYKSNQKTWEKSGWRYMAEEHSHYALDYRIVHEGSGGIVDEGTWHKYDYPGNLYKGRHELIADIIAVFSNLGFSLGDNQKSSHEREWFSNSSQVFYSNRQTMLFEVKAFKNGNAHFRFMPAAIKALNVEAGRLLGWLKSPDDVVAQLGYSAADAKQYFRSSIQLTASSLKLLPE